MYICERNRLQDSGRPISTLRGLVSSHKMCCLPGNTDSDLCLQRLFTHDRPRISDEPQHCWFGRRDCRSGPVCEHHPRGPASPRPTADFPPWACNNPSSLVVAECTSENVYTGQCADLRPPVRSRLTDLPGLSNVYRIRDLTVYSTAFTDMMPFRGLRCPPNMQLYNLVNLASLHGWEGIEPWTYGWAPSLYIDPAPRNISALKSMALCNEQGNTVAFAPYSDAVFHGPFCDVEIQVWPIYTREIMLSLCPRITTVVLLLIVSLFSLVDITITCSWIYVHALLKNLIQTHTHMTHPTNLLLRKVLLNA